MNTLAGVDLFIATAIPPCPAPRNAAYGFGRSCESQISAIRGMLALSATTALLSLLLLPDVLQRRPRIGIEQRPPLSFLPAHDDWKEARSIVRAFMLIPKVPK